MADNVTLNSGSGGATLAADDIAGIHHQRVKVQHGADGSATDVSSASPMPIDWAGTAPPIGAGVEATALRVTVATDSTGVLSIDDNGGNISVDWGGTAPPIGAGTEAAALRVTVATDSTGVLSVDDNGGSITVDSGAAFTVQEDGAALTALQLIDDVVFVDDTATHTAATTKVAGVGVVAVPTDTTVDANDIAMPGMSTDRRLWTDTQIVGQDADITIADGGNNISVDWGGTVPPIGAGTEAAALRVTVATDSTGVLSVDDNGSALTVDNAGTFAVQVDGAALTALQLIDNTVYVDDADWTDATSSHMLVGGLYQSTPQTVTDGDVAPFNINTNGSLHVSIQEDSVGIGGGTQYTEDDAAAANPVGNAQILVSDSTPALEVAEGANVAQRGTRYGAAYTQIVDSSGNFVDSFGGSGGTAAADDADFTAGTTQGTPAMGVYESSPTSVTDGDLGVVGISVDRRLHTDAQIVGQDADITIADGGNNISVDWGGTVPPIGAGTEAAALRVTLATDSTGVVSVDDNGSSLTVDSGAAFTVQEDGAALTALQLIDDIVYTDDTSTHATGTSKGALVMAAATPTDGSVGANDIGAVAMSTDRRLHTDTQIVGQDANLTVDLGATDNAVLDAIQAAVEIMDDWDETNRAAVNPISGQAGVAGNTGTRGATTQRVTIATDDEAITALQLIDNTVAVLGTATYTEATTSGNVIGAVRNDTPAALANTDNEIAPVQVSAEGGIWTTPTGSADGGMSIFRDIDLDEADVSVKGSAGTLYSICAYNTTAAPLYLQLYDATTASVTVGTTTADLTFVIPGNADSDGAGFVIDLHKGWKFSTAITAACTTGVSDAGAPGANACIVAIGYV